MTDTSKDSTFNRRRLLQSLTAIPLLAATGLQAKAFNGEEISSVRISGEWRLQLDPSEKGVNDRWFASALADRISLPGGIETAGLGHAVGVTTPWTGDINDRSYFTDETYAQYRQDGNIKVPFFLQPDTWYRGAAWYQREVVITEAWHKKRVELFIERAHWETQVWIGDRALGKSNALHVPHVYDLGVLPVGRHTLTVRVDNRMIVEIGHNGHGITDHTQGNWNGLAGRIELRAYETVWIEGVDLYPDHASHSLLIKGRLGNATGKAGKGKLRITFYDQTLTIPVQWDRVGGEFETKLSVNATNVEALRPWDEFEPALHDVTLKLSNGEQWEGRFGWRTITANRDGFQINGRPMFFRGALDCAIFPETGHPATDMGTWRRIMQRVKDYGLNHIRFHSYCPPEAAFEAADEAGIYALVEIVWAGQSAYIGSGAAVDQWVYEECDRILSAHGNHPCIVLMTHGNEPGGGTAPDGNTKRDAFLGKFVEHYRAKDPRRLWTSGAGWPEIPANDFHITPTPRTHQWGEGLKSRMNGKAPETVTDYRDFVGKYDVPVISHEIGQWCAYPNLSETRKYKGYLKGKNFEIFADRLRDNGLETFASVFLYASGRLQALCYKEDIESALRTHRMGGFQLLGLQDFPGQGTALVGVLDPFWDDKGYISAGEYQRFCGPITPLARMDTRIISNGSAFEFGIDIANFGPNALEKAHVVWRVADSEGAIKAQGQFRDIAIPLGNAPLNLAAKASLTVDQPTAAKLIVGVRQQGETLAENDWDIWIYPKPVATQKSPKLLHAARIDKSVLDHLAKGGDVLLGVDGASVKNFAERPVKLGFTSIFWNTLWTKHQAPTTLGILCDPGHPALSTFPTDSHSNWQWWYPMHGAGAFRLDLLPDGVTPIVRVIDDWFTARSLGLIIELKVGKGRIIMCGFPLIENDVANPVIGQLVASLTSYMSSAKFQPSVTVSAQQLSGLLES